ncbi:MAG: SMP-30/gluconolactonase/LRE family protein, partial [Betaproteobacteria bacterium]|nr:SMP-30/gluconolactonase/LRE family protein [Betaproteobacteria bacterium]
MTSGPAIAFEVQPRYPDPRVEVLDERFLKLRLFSASVEQLATGMRWAE